MPMRIPVSDVVYRHAVHPEAFKKNTLDRGRLFHFGSDPLQPTMSVAWERFVPTEKLIHGYGLRMVAARNRKISDPAKHKKYCGAYQFLVSDVLALPNDASLSDVEAIIISHLEENGEIAHANLTIQVRAGCDDVPGVKTAILDRLWNIRRGPLHYFSEGAPEDGANASEARTDQNGAPQLKPPNLPALDNSLPLVRRGKFMTALRLIQFHIFTFSQRLMRATSVVQ